MSANSAGLRQPFFRTSESYAAKRVMVLNCGIGLLTPPVGALHAHPHEQIGYIISGKLIYQEEGQEDKILGTGDSYYVAPNVVHGVQILEDTKLLDIFTPMREDFIS